MPKAKRNYHPTHLKSIVYGNIVKKKAPYAQKTILHNCQKSQKFVKIQNKTVHTDNQQVMATTTKTPNIIVTKPPKKVNLQFGTHKPYRLIN
jgi:hypothetical protein